MTLQKGWAKGIGFFFAILSVISFLFLGSFNYYNLNSLPGMIIPIAIAVIFLWAGFTNHENAKKVNKYGGIFLVIMGILSVFSWFDLGIIRSLGYFSYFSFFYFIVGIPTLLIGLFGKGQETEQMKSTKIYKAQALRTN